MQYRNTHPSGFALGICASTLHTNLGNWSITRLSLRSLRIFRDPKPRDFSILSEARLILRAWGSLKKYRDHWTRSLTDLEYDNRNHGTLFDLGTGLLLHSASFFALGSPVLDLLIRPLGRSISDMGPPTDQPDCFLYYSKTTVLLCMYTHTYFTPGLIFLDGRIINC